MRSTYHKCLDDAATSDASGGHDVGSTECCIGGGVRVALGVVQAVLADQKAAEIP